MHKKHLSFIELGNQMRRKKYELEEKNAPITVKSFLLF